MTHKLLFVDDEENILHALARLFRKSDYEVKTALGGKNAIEALQAEDFSLVISDLRMPGMGGIEVLQEAKRLRPDSMRIILTGYAEVETAIEAINKGDVYRFIKKPWDNHDLIQVVKEALTLYDMRRENKELHEEVQRQNQKLRDVNAVLDEKVKERTAELIDSVNKANMLNQMLQLQNLAMIRAFSSIIDLRNNLLGEHCRRVGRRVVPLCKALGIDDTSEIQQITLAALLHDIGKVGLSDVTLNKSSKNLVGKELQDVRNHPIIGQGQVQFIQELVPVGLLIRNHHENFDGTGYPDGLAGESIPLGARILRVLDSFDRACFRGEKWRDELAEEVLLGMNKFAGKKYDVDVLHTFMELMNLDESQYMARREEKTTINSLAVGMTLSRDIRTRKGQLVLPAEEELNQGHIDKIRNYQKLFAIDQQVYIYSDEGRE